MRLIIFVLFTTIVFIPFLLLGATASTTEYLYDLIDSLGQALAEWTEGR